MRFRALGALLALPLVAAAGSPALEERVLVRRVRLPIYLEAAKPDACRGVTAASIEIREDGLAVPALHLDTERLPAEHALLLDTSESMNGRLGEVRQAASDYLGALPTGEPALVAGFDDDLILYAPMSADRERLRRQLATLATGWQTRLVETLGQMIGYLGSRERRVVLIVLSDGCDTDLDPAAAEAGLVEAATSVAGLSVYTIGLDLPARCEGSAVDPRQGLRALARATGAEFIAIDSPAEMKGVLARIRATLERERFVVYEPPPFGAAPEDRAGERTERWRRVELALRGDHPGCRVRHGASARRLERAAEVPATEPAAGPFAYDPRSGFLGGKIEDVLRDRGPLSHRDILGAVRVEIVAREESGERQVAAPVPALDLVAWPGALPEYAFFHALMLWTPEAERVGVPRLANEVARPRDVPFLIHGGTLLRERLALGRALAEQPDYRRWATDRLRTERLEAIERDLGGEVDRAQLALVRAHYASPEWRPEAGALSPFLGAWLGDVPALRLHRAAEPWLIQRRLNLAAETGGGAGAAGWTADAERLWRTLGFVLGEHRDVRVFGLLVPGFDPDQDRVGFHRIVLPRPTTLVNVFHPSPDAPRGLRLLDWALDRPAFAEALAGAGFVATSVDYDAISMDSAALWELAGLPRPGGETPTSLIRVRVELRSRGGAPERAVLRAVFARGDWAGVTPDDPLCIEIALGAGEGPRGERVVRALIEAGGERAPACLVGSQALDARLRE